MKALRLQHWIKSGFCLAALFLSGEWKFVSQWIALIPLLVGFSLLSSAGYLFNDLKNLQEDRHHPRKRRRPVAAGHISSSSALVACFMLATIGAALLFRVYGWSNVEGMAAWCGLLYLGLTLLYSSGLRAVPYLDVLTLGLGFVMRVSAGAFALGKIPTVWLLLITYCLALLLGFGKRLGELLLTERVSLSKGITRMALGGYRMTMLRFLVGLSAFFLVGLYVTYCLFGRENRVLFILTVAPVVVGVLAYLRLACRTDMVESPEKLLFSSRTLLGSIIAWVLMVIVFG